jgi:hypothetical protein
MAGGFGGGRTIATLVRTRPRPPRRGWRAGHPIRVMTRAHSASTMGDMAVQHPLGGPRPPEPAAAAPTVPALPESRFQTVRIRKGRHDSPAHGACVMELASMLAGERFHDHPQSVCPVLAGFLRGYNDLLPDGQHGELYPYAALVVGTAGSRRVRRERARVLLRWADRGRHLHRRRLYLRFQPWDIVLLPAVEAALRMDPERRRTAVAALLEELCALGRPADRPLERAADAPAAAAGGDRPAPATANVR